MNYFDYYKKNFSRRIKFTKKYSYVYRIIADEINKYMSSNSRISIYCAGHSIITNYLKFKSAYVGEIIDEFLCLFKLNKNIFKLKENKKVDEVVVCDLEYASNPVQKMIDLNRLLNSDGKVYIVSNNIFWNPFFKLLEILNLKFRHPRKNLISSNFIENLCFLTDFRIVKKKRFLLFPFKIFFFSSLMNNFFAKIPFINYFCLIQLFVLRSNNKEKLCLENLKTSIIVPCKNEEKNINAIVKSIKRIGSSTEILFGDDNSSDNTLSEIKKNLVKTNDLTIKYYKGPGISKAENVYKGFNLASGDILIIHDADNCVSFSELDLMVRTLIEKKLELVIGTRFIYPMEEKAMRSFNYFGNIIFSYIFSFLLQQKITDTLCGTKILHKKDWLKIKKQCGSWGIKDKWGDFDLLLGAKANFLKLAEIPVNYKKRTEEESKMTNVFSNGLRMLVISVISFFKLRF